MWQINNPFILKISFYIHSRLTCSKDAQQGHTIILTRGQKVDPAKNIQQMFHKTLWNQETWWYAHTTAFVQIMCVCFNCKNVSSTFIFYFFIYSNCRIHQVTSVTICLPNFRQEKRTTQPLHNHLYFKDKIQRPENLTKMTRKQEMQDIFWVITQELSKQSTWYRSVQCLNHGSVQIDNFSRQIALLTHMPDGQEAEKTGPWMFVSLLFCKCFSNPFLWNTLHLYIF